MSKTKSFVKSDYKSILIDIITIICITVLYVFFIFMAIITIIFAIINKSALVGIPTAIFIHHAGKLYRKLRNYELNT